MNYNYPSAIFRSIFAQNVQFFGRKYIFTIFGLELFKVKMKKNVNNNRNTFYLGQNTSKYCSQIIAVYAHANVFSLKFTQRITKLQTVSNQEVTLERLISMLWIAQKLYGVA